MDGKTNSLLAGWLVSFLLGILLADHLPRPLSSPTLVKGALIAVVVLGLYLPWRMAVHRYWRKRGAPRPRAAAGPTGAQRSGSAG